MAALQKPSSLDLSLLTCVMGIKSTALSKKMEECFDKNKAMILSVSLQLISTQRARDDGDSELAVPLAGGRVDEGCIPEPETTVPLRLLEPSQASAPTLWTLSHTQLHMRKGRTPRVGDRRGLQ